MFRDIWKKYGYEICIFLSILVILILSFFRKGKKGTWSNTYFLEQKSFARKPPQESKGEVECRRVLEEIFGVPFPKTRPDFLRNPITSNGVDSNNLEIDCYNDRLKLGVEYNGIQHYKYIPYFHKTKDSFHNQKYRDYVKNDICQKNGITLIEVPYTVKVPEIKSFILNKLSPKYNKWIQRTR
jgi:hypothetical protein